MRDKLTTVNGTGPVRRLQVQTLIHAPIEKVWQAVTQIEHVKQWWADGAIGSQAGESITLGDGQDVNGTILVMREPYIFEYTWHDEPAQSVQPDWLHHPTNSMVRMDFVEEADGDTLVNLVSYSPKASGIGAAAGWHHLFERCKAYVEIGDANTVDPNRFEDLKLVYADES